MHQESLHIWIIDGWIVIESWGQWRFTPLQTTSPSKHNTNYIFIQESRVFILAHTKCKHVYVFNLMAIIDDNMLQTHKLNVSKQWL